jgi:hypothetical protein
LKTTMTAALALDRAMSGLGSNGESSYNE